MRPPTLTSPVPTLYPPPPCHRCPHRRSPYRNPFSLSERNKKGAAHVFILILVLPASFFLLGTGYECAPRRRAAPTRCAPGSSACAPRSACTAPASAALLEQRSARSIPRSAGTRTAAGLSSSRVDVDGQPSTREPSAGGARSSGRAPAPARRHRRAGVAGWRAASVGAAAAADDHPRAALRSASARIGGRVCARRSSMASLSHLGVTLGDIYKSTPKS